MVLALFVSAACYCLVRYYIRTCYEPLWQLSYTALSKLLWWSRVNGSRTESFILYVTIVLWLNGHLSCHTGHAGSWEWLKDGNDIAGACYRLHTWGHDQQENSTQSQEENALLGFHSIVEPWLYICNLPFCSRFSVYVSIIWTQAISKEKSDIAAETLSIMS